jgi:hypothetical protein
LHDRFDCILLDIDIEKDIREKIKSKFQGVPIIYLPSLDSEQVFETDIKYISEPLRLSELVITLDEIFRNRIPS